MRRRARAVVEVTLFTALLGGPDGALGVLWPSMAAELRRPAGDLGLLEIAATGTYLLASSTAGLVMRSLGAGRYIAAAAVIGTAGLAAWAWGASWVVVLGSFVVLGLAKGALDAGLNAQVASEHGVARLGLLHAAYGAGATFGPALATAAIVSGAGWRAAVVVLGVVVAAAAAWATALRHDWGTVGASPGPSRRAVHMPVASVVVTLALFFVYVGLEAGVGSWGFLLLRERGTSTAVAGTWATLFWGALTAGRLGLAVIGTRVPSTVLLRAACLLACVGVAVLWSDAAGLGAVGLPVIGLGLAVVFPVLISLTPERVGEDAAPTVIGWSVASAALGGVVLIAAFGQYGERAGFDQLGPPLAALAAMLVALELLASRVPRRTRRS